MGTEHVVICDPAEARELGYDAYDQDVTDEQLETFGAVTPEQRAAARRRDEAVRHMRARARRPWFGRTAARDALVLQGLEW